MLPFFEDEAACLAADLQRKNRNIGEIKTGICEEGIADYLKERER